MTQTVRYFASSLGLAVLGTILIDQTRTHIVRSLTREGAPASVADRVASSFNAGTSARPAPGSAGLALIRHDFAQSTRVVFIGMAIVMAASFVAALGMQRGVPPEVSEAIEQRPAVDGGAVAEAAH